MLLNRYLRTVSLPGQDQEPFVDSKASVRAGQQKANLTLHHLQQTNTRLLQLKASNDEVRSNRIDLLCQNAETKVNKLNLRLKFMVASLESMSGKPTGIKVEIEESKSISASSRHEFTQRQNQIPAQNQAAAQSQSTEVESISDLQRVIETGEKNLFAKALAFIDQNPLAASSSYTRDDLSLLMLAASHVHEASFLSDLIDLVAVKKQASLRLAKKSAQDKSVFDILVQSLPQETASQLFDRLKDLAEFKKLKLAQRKKATAMFEK